MLTQFYPPIIGGVERHVHDSSVELVARGHDVAVATLWHEGMPAFECVQGVRIYRIHGSLQRMSGLFVDKGQQHAPPFPDPEVLWALRRIILQECPDIVHGHNWMVHSFTPLKSWSKAKLVVSLHDCSLSCAEKAFMFHGTLCDGPALTKCVGCAAEHYGVAKGVPIALGNWICGQIERQMVDMFLPVSWSMVEANQLLEHAAPFRVIPNFVPKDMKVLPDDDNALLAQLPEENYLLFVGNVGRDKGVEVLLRAYAELDCDVPLVLIGRVDANFTTPMPANVQILHSWPHEAVMGAWRRCTIALVPSICLESFGMVALEAMLMERPIIASRIGGLSDIVVDGETGFLVTPGNVQALREAMQCLLTYPLLRASMGGRGRQRMAEFQAKTVVPRIEQAYQEVLQT